MLGDMGCAKQVGYGGGGFDPKGTGAYALKVSGEVWNELHATVMQRNGLENNHPSVWMPPEEGWVKVNVDAGELGEVGSGLGVVIRDNNGSLLACATMQGCEKWEPEVVEAKAMVYEMQVSKEMGLSKVVFESDCFGIVNALRAGLVEENSFSLIVGDMLHLRSYFASVHRSFVKRSGNNIAHSLAHLLPGEFGRRL